MIETRELVFDFGYVDDDDREVELDIEVNYDHLTDDSYGEDRDGNRGIPVSWNEDIQIKILNGRQDKTDYIKTNLPEVYQEIVAEAKTLIEQLDEQIRFGYKL